MESLDRYAAVARQVELFRGIDPDDVHKILHKGITMRVGKGEVIFHKGTTGNTMFIILGGSVALFDGKKQLAVLRTGDMFGEMAIINNEPRSASALAAEDSLLFVLDETTFHKLMTKSVAIRMLLNIIATMSHRLRKANERLTALEG
jgi:CRP-like cAMP-binding protein